jgi:hypothetical protein
MEKNMKMSDEEIDIISTLEDLYGKFNSLSVQHSKDLDEVIYHLHCLQHLVMIRCVRREYPDLFPIKIIKDASLNDLANLGSMEKFLSEEITNRLNSGK